MQLLIIFMDQIAAINQSTVLERLFLLYDVCQFFFKFVVNCIVSCCECWSPTCVSSHKMTSHIPYQLSFILFPDISLLLCAVALWICIDVLEQPLASAR